MPPPLSLQYPVFTTGAMMREACALSCQMVLMALCVVFIQSTVCGPPVCLFGSQKGADDLGFSEVHPLYPWPSIRDRPTAAAASFWRVFKLSLEMSRADRIA